MKKIAVFGAGAMGRGIVQVAVQAGLDVIVFDRFDKVAGLQQSAENDIWSRLFQLKSENGKLVYRSREEVNQAVKKIKWLIAEPVLLAELKTCDAAIEAIFENVRAKHELYVEIEKYLPESALLLTNTSTIQINCLAHSLAHPERFMGMHFFNPVPVMRPVELIPHDQTSNETILAAKELTEKMGKKPLLAPDLPGFVVNRIAIPMVTAFAKELENGADYKVIDKAFTDGTWPIYPPARRIVEAMIDRAEQLLTIDQKDCRVKLIAEKIDELMELGINMPVGPLKLKEMLKEGTATGVKFVMGPAQFCDLVGIDVCVDCCEMLKMQEPDSWEVPELLRDMVKAGKKGRKTGEGFYTYAGKVSVKVDRSIAYISYKGDVLSRSLVVALTKAFKNWTQELKGIVLEVRAKGADIKEFPLGFKDPASVEATIESWHELVKAIRDCPAPVVAVIRGYALGGGYELALACDYIIAEEGATIGLPEIGLGILPGGGGTQNLPYQVGYTKALKMILGGLRIKAKNPWVGQVNKPSEIDNAVNAIMNCFRAGLPGKKNRAPFELNFWNFLKNEIVTLGLMAAWKMKKPASFDLAETAIWGSMLPIKNRMDWEKREFLRAMATADAEEGIRAFLEKRKPNFTGK